MLFPFADDRNKMIIKQNSVLRLYAILVKSWYYLYTDRISELSVNKHEKKNREMNHPNEHFQAG